jgi:hypothetical protein
MEGCEMSAKTDVLAMQCAWAGRVGLAPDDRGYVPTFAENLYQPLSARALAAFRHGSGNELQDKGASPAKMRALHSSSALVVNLFDYWAERDLSLVVASLGLRPDRASIEFEAQFRTGLDGNPPNLDLCVRFENGWVVGVESKFTEWLVPKAMGSEPFKPKYFPDARKLWADHGLEACQTLAEAMHSGVRRFRYLDAAQLLKHALGLACHHPATFELCYLYYEVPSTESAVHRAELDQFADLIRGDFEFQVRTYQELYRRLRDVAGTEHAAYLAYLDARYFSATA